MDPSASIPRVFAASAVAACLVVHATVLPRSLEAQSATKALVRHGVVIEYPAEWEGVAQRLLPWLRARIERLEQQRPEDYVLRIHRNREEILEEISHCLGVSQPAGTMQRFLRQMIQLMGKAVGAMPDPTRVRLWEKNDLIAHLDAGGQLPGYKYDRESNEVTFGASLVSGGSKRVPQPGMAPIVLTQAAEPQLLAEAQGRINRLLNGIESVMPRLAATTLCSTARVGIRQELGVHVPGDMWLVEGASNYIAGELLKRHFTDAMAADFLSALATRPYLDVKGRVDLASWSGVERNRPCAGQRLRSARLAFATAEVTRLIQRHGRDAIAKIFVELKKAAGERKGRDRPGSALRSPVPEAIRKVTGEDISRRLAAYGAG